MTAKKFSCTHLKRCIVLQLTLKKQLYSKEQTFLFDFLKYHICIVDITIELCFFFFNMSNLQCYLQRNLLAIKFLFAGSLDKSLFVEYFLSSHREKINRYSSIHGNIQVAVVPGIFL